MCRSITSFVCKYSGFLENILDVYVDTKRSTYRIAIVGLLLIVE